MRSSELHVLGAGGHGKVVVALAEALGFRHIKLYDDSPVQEVLGYPVVGSIHSLPDTVETQAVIAVGSNTARLKLAGQFQNVRWMSLIHPVAWVSPAASVEAGSVIMAGVIIQPSVRVGRHVIINTAASVDHDCVIGDFVHVAPGARLTGHVHLSEGVFGGAGSVYVPGSRVGAWSIVGAGAVVNKPVPDNVTVVGAPAKVIRERPAGWQLP